MQNEFVTGCAEVCQSRVPPPVVSILIPTYNRKEWLREAIESVFRQHHSLSTEIIIVDDGSTDGTAEALADLFAHPSVQYIQQYNTGKPSSARNRGLREAKGEFVVFLDSDDLLHPDSVIRRVEVFRSFEDVGLVCTDWSCISGSVSLGIRPSINTASKFLEKIPIEMIDHHTDELFVFGKSFVYELLYSEFVFTSSVMIRRKIIDVVGAFDESIVIGEDLDLWLRIGMLTKLAYLDMPLSYMRNHTSHITSDEQRNYLEDKHVIETFLQRSGPIPVRLSHRVGNRLARFYAAGGMVFMRAGNKAKAREFFLYSLRWKPYSLSFIKNLLKTFL